MAFGVSINCDICNKPLDSNEMMSGKGFLGFGENPNKPVSRNRILVKMDGTAGQPKDLCFSCCKKVRDYIESLKLKGR